MYVHLENLQMFIFIFSMSQIIFYFSFYCGSFIIPGKTEHHVFSINPFSSFKLTEKLKGQYKDLFYLDLLEDLVDTGLITFKYFSIPHKDIHLHITKQSSQSGK